MVFFFIFGSFFNFLSKLSPFKSAIFFDDFKEERLPHAQRKREMDVKDMLLNLISQILIFFFWFCVNRSRLMRLFPQTFFFTQYAAPSTEAFVWPSFHFYNFTQRFFQRNCRLVSSVCRAPVCWAGGLASNFGRTNTQGL